MLLPLLFDSTQNSKRNWQKKKTMIKCLQFKKRLNDFQHIDVISLQQHYEHLANCLWTNLTKQSSGYSTQLFFLSLLLSQQKQQTKNEGNVKNISVQLLLLLHIFSLDWVFPSRIWTEPLCFGQVFVCHKLIIWRRKKMKMKKYVMVQA